MTTLRAFIIAAIFGIAVLLIAKPMRANDLDDLKKSIDQKNTEIQKLEEEAKKYRIEIANKQQLGKNLKEELLTIEHTIARLRRDIAITQQKIKRAELQIQEVSVKIREKESSIAKLKKGLTDLLVGYATNERNSNLQLLLSTNEFSTIFKAIDHSSFVQKKILDVLGQLHSLRKELDTEKSDAQAKRDQAAGLKKLLDAKQVAVIGQKNDRTTLLSVTHQQEKIYQKLLAQQEKKRSQLEDEIREIENQIRITIDQSALPARGTGVLGWPLEQLSKALCATAGSGQNCITQFFGYTSFAMAGNYAGKGHNGVDFRADVGTPLYAADSGTITDTGDTDIGCRKASYGKWILISHPNNLSTLYGHLSQISVSKGDQVARGSRIGLTGKTGYATGPHLHLSVFATQGVSVQSIRSKVCGRMMTLPIAATNAYLNPLDYL